MDPTMSRGDIGGGGSSSSTLSFADIDQGGIDPSIFASPSGDFTMEDADWDQDDMDNKVDPSSGPLRGKNDKSGTNGSLGEGSSKGPIAAPVKSACTFCRSRKSRCNGKQPCAACVNRAQPEDCHYTISRRGGKPKSKTAKTEPVEAHLEKIFELSDLPHLVRIPNVVPQLQGFMTEDEDSSGIYSIQSSLANSALSPSFSSRSESVNVDKMPATLSLLRDFYRLFYRFIPILPNQTYLNKLASSMPLDSPFLLALQCVLPLLLNEPLIASPSTNMEEKKAHIRTQSAYFSKKTELAIDAVLERVETRTQEEDYQTLEVIQALCLLIIYECGSGRALKARLKSDTALGIAMSKGLHRLSGLSNSNGIKSPPLIQQQNSHYFSTIPSEEMHEVKKRMWWSLWSMTMWTAYNTGRIPTIRADDPRITSELPKCKDGKAWAYNVSSLQGLLLVQDRVLALSNLENGRTPALDSFHPSGNVTLPNLPFQSSSFRHAVTSLESNDQGIPTSFSGHPTMASRQDILQSMLDIDSALQHQMKVLDQVTHGVVSSNSNSVPVAKDDDDDDDDTRYLHFVWAIQLYTASLTLHVGQAFQGATLFERKLCFLSSISESNDAAACQIPMPNAFDNGFFSLSPSALTLAAPEQDLYARGPFLPKDSLKRCVDASDKLLEISRNLRESPFAAPNNPFNACSFVLISFVCLMQALAISTNVLDDEHWQMAMAPSDATHGNAPSLLKSAQGAAALTSSSSQSFVNGSASARQAQLQHIWSRVKEAKGTLRDLAKHWDMVIPMAEEVGGCLEASQFLLSQQDLSANTLSFAGSAI